MKAALFNVSTGAYRWIIGGMGALLLVLLTAREVYIFGRMDAMDAKIQALQEHLLKALEKRN